MIAGEMRVLECHADVLVPHQGLHRWHGDATHNQPTHKNVAQVMEGKNCYPRLAYCIRKRCAEGSVWFTRTGLKHRAINRYTHSNCLQRGGQHLIHQHAMTFTILDIGCSHVIAWWRKSTSSQVRESNSEARNPVCQAVITSGRSCGATVGKQPYFLFGLSMHPLFSCAKHTFFADFHWPCPQVMTIV